MPKDKVDHKFTPPYYEMGVELRLFATYYNILSQAYEPFIEPWELSYEFEQKDKNSIPYNKLESKTFLEINLSTAMAKCVMDIVNRINESFATLGKMDLIIKSKLQESFILSNKEPSEEDAKSNESNYSKHSTERNDRQNKLNMERL